MNSKPQLKLAAVQIGEILKHSTTLNEINRIASSVFNFKPENFPIQGVTSERAKLIFNWMMTLFKQNIPDSEKRDQVKVFLMNLTPKDERLLVTQKLIDTGILVTDETRQMAGTKLNGLAESEIFSHTFNQQSFRDLPLEVTLCDVLLERMIEAKKCIDSDAFLASVILCGSVLEGLCLGYGCRNPERVNRAYAEKFNKKVKIFPDWKLKEWIEVLSYLGDLSPNVEKFGHSLRDFRNYVHPGEQVASGFSPNLHTAQIGFQVVLAAVDDLLNAQKRLTMPQ